MTDVEIYAAEADRHGGLHSPAGLPTPVAARVEELRAWMAERASVVGSVSGSVVAAHLALLDPLDFNAVASMPAGRPFVGVNVGSVLILDGLFSWMLADRRILAPIGRPELETEHGVPTVGDVYLEALANPFCRPAAPRCPDRVEYADGLTKQALRFLLRHEMVHLANGHVAYLRAAYGDLSLPELRWGEPDSVSVMDRQTMEFDADCCAASWWAGPIVADWFNDAGRAPLAGLDGETLDARAVPDLAPYFFNWAFAVSCLFRLFGDATFAGQDLTSAGYPPNRLRQASVCKTTLDHVRGRYDAGLADRLTDVVTRGLIHAEYAFEILTGRPRVVDGLVEALGTEGLRHIDVLIDHWRGGLRAKLLPYALDGYLPD